MFSRIEINFSSIYIYTLLSLVLGMSVIGGLNFIYEFNLSSVYNFFLALISGLFLVGIFSNELRLKFNNYTRFYLWLFIVATFSYISISYLQFPERKYLLFLGSGLLLTLYSTSIKPEAYRYIPSAIGFFAVFNALLMVGYFNKFGGVEELKWSMITEANSDVIYISRTLGLGVLLSFFYINNRIIKILLVTISIFFLVILNEIGPILAIVLVVFTFYARKNKLYLFIALILGMFFYLFVVTKFVSDLTVEEVLKDPRVEIYLRNLGYFLDNPFWGIGIAGSVKYIGQYQSAHNIFFEIAGEFGILGLIPFAFMIVMLFTKFIKNKDFLFGYLWLYSFIVVQFSGDIGLNAIFWFFSAVFMSTPSDNKGVISTQLGI